MELSAQQTKDLKQAYTAVESARQKLALILSEIGCVHSNATELTSFTDKSAGVRKWFCHDCGETVIGEVTEDELGMGL